MIKFKEFMKMNEGSTVKVYVGDLINQYSDGGEQEQDDFYYFTNSLKNFGLKDKDWHYADEEDTIVIPKKYTKFIKSWNVNITESSKNNGAELKNAFKISWGDAKKISKNYGQKWESEGSLEMMYDAKEHVMTYNKKTGELFTDFSKSQIDDMVNDRPISEGSLTEGSFKFYDKVQLNRVLPKSRGQFLTWDNEGKWSIEDKEQKDNCIKVDDVLDYYSLDYNQKTSVTVALKDLERGKFDKDEVEPR